MYVGKKEQLELQPELDQSRFEFHISRFSRDKYAIDHSLFSKEGHILTADYHAVARLARQINSQRDLKHFPDSRISTAELYALGLIHEIFHHIISVYAEQTGTEVIEELAVHFQKEWDPDELDTTLTGFIDHYPPTPVYLKELSTDEYLKSRNGSYTGRETAVEEMMLLWITNQNPAIRNYKELVDDTPLSSDTHYQSMIKQAYLLLEKLPTVPGSKLNLIDYLQMPAHESPDSILAQLDYIAAHWQPLLGAYLEKLLRGIDYLKEEQRPAFPPGPGPSRELNYHDMDFDFEAFSQDTHWMPRVVLIAKSTFVWLDQLTRRYGYFVQRLDQIPDDELNRLADQGFNALWLIGLWERSIASKTIKRSCGNPEAEASAYSLKRYEIAEELGGWEALENLRNRCAQRGIRLASDMVPNHTGIDGDWVYDHPDWYLQLPHPPYPAYKYESQNLSDHPGIGIYLEDHYYDRTDAALTFKWQNFNNGETRYIYHGNDGTSMPWNDTAQLDFLNPELREALIQTILHVARNFSIIRFDAAMTLARKHIHRLWYPAPGSGGDIPGRSLHGMSQEEFYQKLPKEFWREVVDRVAAEAPDTLLLAEAFWMMEGFFVRTLGMHRVYNSAFMNMLKDEENEKYKNTIKNTINFDPEILKRFVNFMNNPDEDTAIAQFGDGDKYFGVCTLMVTMPGLPMFGHGQIEGFREKYGMEYRKAYWDEHPNQALVSAHYHLIFPLMKRRALFADSYNFRLYDLYLDDGSINHNAFVYSNRNGHEASLVAYNNSYSSFNGHIHHSAPYAVKDGENSKRLETCSIAEGLGLENKADHFTIFREQRSGLWYIRQNQNIVRDGLFIHLQGYESQVYLDFYQVYDHDGLYRKLFESLEGRGVPDIELRKKELFLAPIHHAFSRFLHEPMITPIRQAVLKGGGIQKFSYEDYWSYFDDFMDECIQLGYGNPDQKDSAIGRFQKNLDTLDRLSQLSHPETRPHSADQAGYYHRGLSMMPEVPLILLSWLLLSPLEEFQKGDAKYSSSADMAADLLLPQQFRQAFLKQRIPEESHPHLHKLMLTILSHDGWTGLPRPYTDEEKAYSLSPTILEELIRRPLTSDFLQLHQDDGIEWYHGESMQELIWWLDTLAILDQIRAGENFPDDSSIFPVIKTWIHAEENAEYQLGKFMVFVE